MTNELKFPVEKQGPELFFIFPSWVNQQLPWLFAVGADGRAVAILQDAMLEIRTVRDSYAAPIGKTYVSKEPWPQWRRLQWSPDGTLLACARSNGQVPEIRSSPVPDASSNPIQSTNTQLKGWKTY